MSCQKHRWMNRSWISIESGFIEQQSHRYCSFMAAVCQILPLSLISLAKANTGSFIPVLMESSSTSDTAHHTELATKGEGSRDCQLGNWQKGWWSVGVRSQANRRSVRGCSCCCGICWLQDRGWALELNPGTKGRTKSSWTQVDGQAVSLSKSSQQ